MKSCQRPLAVELRNLVLRVCMMLFGCGFLKWIPSCCLPSWPSKSCCRQLFVLHVLACVVYQGAALLHTRLPNTMNPRVTSLAKRQVVARFQVRAWAYRSNLSAPATRSETGEGGLGKHLVLGNVRLYGICGGHVVLQARYQVCSNCWSDETVLIRPTVYKLGLLRRPRVEWRLEERSTSMSHHRCRPQRQHNNLLNLFHII